MVSIAACLLHWREPPKSPSALYHHAHRPGLCYHRSRIGRNSEQRKGNPPLGPLVPGVYPEHGQRGVLVLKRLYYRGYRMALDQRVYYRDETAVYTRGHARTALRSSATQGERPSQSTPSRDKNHHNYCHHHRALLSFSSLESVQR